MAVGRKNWLFADSFEGATRAALMYSLVQSCALIDVSPFDYLKDVLLREAGVAVKEPCHKHGFLEGTYLWRSKFGGDSHSIPP